MTTPRFSVVMPSYQQREYLGAAIDSVLAQDLDGAIELIVMDGGSTDGSVELLESYGDRITWVSEPDRGQSDALNKGILRARGAYLAWLNSDDVLLPGALRRVAARFDAEPDLKWVIGRCKVIDAAGEETRSFVTRYKNARIRRWTYEGLLTENFISQPAVFLRRDVFDEVGLLDESRHLAMDYDLWLRIGRNHEPGIIDEDLAAFRVHGSSKTEGDSHRSLREASNIARQYAHEYGKPWLGTVNHWWFFRRTQLIYGVLRRLESLKAR